jgi:uncharacterized membrane protein
MRCAAAMTDRSGLSSARQSPGRVLAGALWFTVSLLSLIMITVATRRLLHLSAPAMQLDAGFERHSVLTLAHILPGIVFVLLGPFQFMAGLRKRRPSLHRWMGRLFLADSLLIGVTALVMSPQMAIGGALETAATFVFGLLFLYALARALAAIRARRVAEHRRWMIRAYAIGLGVATVRPIVGVFFATSRITHLTPHDFFGIAFWLGFMISIATAEAWIRFTAAESRT